MDAVVQGERRKLLVQANRNGFYYVLDRTDGKFLHGTPFIKQLNWAKGLTPEGRPIRVPGIIPSIQGTRTCPATAGATNWHSPAYNPDTNLFYVSVMEGCGINYKSRDTFRPGGVPFMATGYVEDPEAPWQIYVRALDLTTGKMKWEYKQVGSNAMARDCSRPRADWSSPETIRECLPRWTPRAAKPLWHFNTGQPITASPITYSFKGKQYVALAAGSNVLAFALHERN